MARKATGQKRISADDLQKLLRNLWLVDDDSPMTSFVKEIVDARERGWKISVQLADDDFFGIQSAVSAVLPDAKFFTKHETAPFGACYAFPLSDRLADFCLILPYLFWTRMRALNLQNSINTLRFEMPFPITFQQLLAEGENPIEIIDAGLRHASTSVSGNFASGLLFNGDKNETDFNNRYYDRLRGLCRAAQLYLGLDEYHNGKPLCGHYIDKIAERKLAEERKSAPRRAIDDIFAKTLANQAPETGPLVRVAWPLLPKVSDIGIVCRNLYLLTKICNSDFYSSDSYSELRMFFSTLLNYEVGPAIRSNLTSDTDSELRNLLESLNISYTFPVNNNEYMLYELAAVADRRDEAQRQFSKLEDAQRSSADSNTIRILEHGRLQKGSSQPDDLNDEQFNVVLLAMYYTKLGSCLTPQHVRKYVNSNYTSVADPWRKYEHLKQKYLVLDKSRKLNGEWKVNGAVDEDSFGRYKSNVDELLTKDLIKWPSSGKSG